MTFSDKHIFIISCLFNKIPIISSMGAGGRLDPTKVRYADLWETYNDGLAKAAHESPEVLHQSPRHTPIGRPDEVKAARKPVLRYHWEE